MNPHPFHLQPDMMVGPWRIQARLGAGGFGAVFRVECGGETFALKFAVHGPDSEDLNRTDARARRELACLVLTHHPHVVRVWAHGRWPHPRTGYHYVVMDYVEGPTLSDWVRLSRPPLRQVLQLFATLARTLHSLHAQDIHHRDLKGSNILVRASDGQPVLVDFGAGNHAESFPLTEGPLPPGTPHLRTPEALRFHREQYANPLAHYPFRPTDDLYALGGTLYEVLTGVPPFPPQLPRDVLIHHIETRPPLPPDTLNPSVPPALAQLVLRLLAKRPEERPESGQALDDQLQALLRDGGPALDVPLGPSPEALTTEGMGPPPATLGVDLPPGTPLGEASAPTVRSEPAAPAHGPRRHRAALGAMAVLSLLGLGLWWAGASPGGAPGAPPAPALPAPVVAEPPPPALPPDTRLPLESTADAGSPPVAAATPRPPAPKGPPMLKQSPVKKPEDAPASPSPGTLPRLVGVAVTTCALASGCASNELVVRPRPPKEECPVGFQASQQRIYALTGRENALFHVRFIGSELNLWPQIRELPRVSVTAPDGPFQVESIGQLSAVLPGIVFSGQAYRTKEVFLARFTEARLPDGERLPVCVQLMRLRSVTRENIDEPWPEGWRYEPDAPADSWRVEPAGEAMFVWRFGDGNR